MLKTYGLNPRGTDYRSLLRAAQVQDCDLCMVYAEVEDTDADAEFVGLLWDAKYEEPLIAYRVPVFLPIEVREQFDEEDSESYQQMMAEAAFRAESDLRQMVRASLWELAANDGKVPKTKPSPWRTDLPLYPRDYSRNLRVSLNQGPKR